MKRPNSIVGAVFLLWATLAIGLANVVAGLMAGSIANTVFVWWILTFVALFVVWIVVKIASGRNWARVTFLVLFVLGLPFAQWQNTVLVIQSGFELAALVLLFVPASNEWFRLKRAAKLAGDLQKLGAIQ